MRLKFRFLVVRVTWGKSLDRKRKQGESVTKSFKLRELNGKNRDVYFTIRVSGPCFVSICMDVATQINVTRNSSLSPSFQGKIQLTFGDFAVGEILQSFRGKNESLWVRIRNFFLANF